MSLSIRQQRREKAVKMSMAVELQRSTDRLNLQLKRTKRGSGIDPYALIRTLRHGSFARRAARLNRAVRYFENHVRPRCWLGDGVPSRVPTKADRNRRRASRLVANAGGVPK